MSLRNSEVTGKPIQNQSAYILEYVAPSEARKDAPQGPRVEVIFGEVLVNLDVAPNLPAMIDAVDVKLRSLDLCQVEMSEHTRSAVEE
ncbi:hypothetical protein RRF57_008960 [Xylaria bambusicola]|uniref:Uncharacterized protein n=1 Tax=Xylaria bambusicola TaxID=326684 RepID=A0AAN7ZBM5_9PEZI